MEPAVRRVFHIALGSMSAALRDKKTKCAEVGPGFDHAALSTRPVVLLRGLRDGLTVHDVVLRPEGCLTRGGGEGWSSSRKRGLTIRVRRQRQLTKSTVSWI